MCLSSLQHNLKKTTKVLFFALALTLSFGGYSCSGGVDIEGLPAPDFTVTDLKGKEINLFRLKGDPIILYFFASW
jgi:cytochrome oxidase Cu insertion factor (SCO1/SenC/PrrC family)